MEIGFSCTVWAGGERTGHLDGIGIYSRALWQSLNEVAQSSGIRFKPHAFGKNLPPMPCGAPQVLAKDYRIHVILSGVLKLPLSNSAAISRELDLFHATDHHIPLIRGVPTVATIMDLIPLLHPEWIKQDLKSLKSWLFANSIRRADHIITISEYSKQDMVRHLGIEPERISVTPLGVDPIYFERIEAPQREAVLDKHGLKPGFFLFVGTLQPRKNLPRVLEAFQQLPEDVRKAHPLVIVGRDGWSNEELLPQLEALQQRGEGRWLNYLPQNEVLALLQSAGALVFASLYEGFGLPVLEAMASGTPVVVTRSSAMPEVAGAAGNYIDADDADGLRDAMSRLIDDQTHWQACREAGLQQARFFSWQRCAQATAGAYRQAMGS